MPSMTRMVQLLDRALASILWLPKFFFSPCKSAGRGMSDDEPLNLDIKFQTMAKGIVLIGIRSRGLEMDRRFWNQDSRPSGNSSPPTCFPQSSLSK